MSPELKRVTETGDHIVQAELSESFESKELELDHEATIQFLADKIQELKAEETKVVSFIAAPAAGKTTFADDLVSELERRGEKAAFMGSDGFVVKDREYRRAHLEGKDPLAKYDFQYMLTLIERIKNNKDPNVEIGVPRYDDSTGLGLDAGEENYKKIGPVDFLIVEGDFDPVPDPDLHVYMHVPDEVRLQNRIDRDLKIRNENLQAVIDTFNLRQKLQHLPYTVPSIKKSDLVLEVDSKEGRYSYTIHTRKE